VTVRVELDGFGPAPLDDWSCYPGLRTEFSYLFCGDHLRALDRIDFDVELSSVDAPPMADRRAVLAYGSNACPAQLRRKYVDADCSPIIPMTRAWASNLAIGYSDHASRYGAIPATLMASEGVCTEVFIAWLDPEQFDHLDGSEARNYERRALDLRAHDLYVADGPRPHVVDAYVSLRGVLTRGGVTPAVKGIDTTYRDGPILDQVEARRLRAAPERRTP
jgi:hypothetical protein